MKKCFSLLFVFFLTTNLQASASSAEEDQQNDVIEVYFGGYRPDPAKAAEEDDCYEYDESFYSRNTQALAYDTERRMFYIPNKEQKLEDKTSKPAPDQNGCVDLRKNKTNGKRTIDDVCKKKETLKYVK